MQPEELIKLVIVCKRCDQTHFIADLDAPYICKCGEVIIDFSDEGEINHCVIRGKQLEFMY